MNFYYITRDGYAIDSYGNEVRDENGAVILVPESERHFYDIAYRHDEMPDDND